MANAVTATKLIGTVKVQPPTVRPGESVFVQVCDSNGRPYTGASNVRVTIEGVEAPARYFQFAVPGTINLTVCATQGDLVETSVVTVQVNGEPVAYRRTLSSPGLTSLPMLQLRQSLGSPYLATFELGTPESLLPSLAQKHSPAMTTNPASTKIASAVDLAKLSGNVTTPSSTASGTSTAQLQAEVTKTLSTLRAETITRMPSCTITNTDGTKVTSSGCCAPLPMGLQANPAATSYKWDFGDGTVFTTQSPTATHDFFPAIRSGKVAHCFDVSCTVEHDNLTVKRTLVLHSAYELCRQLGTIVPHVTGEVYATNQTVAFSCSLIVHNLESQAITLNKMACVALSNDPHTDLPAPKFTTMKTPLTIQANSACGLGVYLPLSQLQQTGKLGPNAPGCILYYAGTAADGKTPVRFSYTCRFSLADSQFATAKLPANLSKPFDSTAALQAISTVATDAKCGVSKPGCQVLDPATNTVCIALSSNPHSPSTLAQVRNAMQAGLTTVATNMGVTIKQNVPGLRTMSAPTGGTVQQGQLCNPDNISDTDSATAASQQLVCQLTDTTQTVLMPGSFQNALKGDIVLSPGGNGADQVISGLLRALNPAQVHSHSGIMTQNFVEIAHCTASANRLADNTTGIGGAGGIQPDALQYGWPGSITQTVDAATNGENWIDPYGKTYRIGAFTPEALGMTTNGEFMIIPPLVVKPLPEDEEKVRPMLRQAANTARSKGGRVDANGNITQKPGCYYSFYGYTKPEIAAGFTSQAGAGSGWAQGLSPAVCSSFVWLCLKENNLPLVTQKQYESPSDLSPAATSQGVRVGKGTLDGLFYYTNAERQQAAQVLNQIFENQVLQHEGFFKYIPLVSTDIASNVSDQIMNMFVFNNPNMYGSSAWLAPGDANAVSPDNITCWNLPAFGYAEPLQYLQQHTEQYTASRWTKVTSQGAITGTVTCNGAPVNGANVYVYDGKTATCDANGKYTLGNVPAGCYTLKSQALVNGVQCCGTQTINLSGASLTADLCLQALPVDYRRVDLLCQCSCDHTDDNPFNTHGVQITGPDRLSIPLGPGQVTNGCTTTFDYNGGGYFRTQFQMNAVLAEDLSVQVTITGTMYDDSSNQVQGQRSISFNVPAGAQCAFELDLECTGTGYRNGPCKFTGTAINNQETN